MVKYTIYDSQREELRILKSEGTNYAYSDPPLKFKRRKVSAVRDFPKCFQQSGAKSICPATQAFDSSSTNPVENSFGRNGNSSYEVTDDSDEPSENDLSKDNLVHSEIHRSSSACKSQEEALQLGEELLNSSYDLEHHNQLGNMKHGSSDFCGSLKSTEAFDLKESLGDGGALAQQADEPNVTRTRLRTLSEDYLPQRKVWVIRTFPQGCGRNASVINKESDEVFGSNNSLVKEESFGKIVIMDIKGVADIRADELEDDFTRQFEYSNGSHILGDDKTDPLEVPFLAKLCTLQRRPSAIRDFPPGCGRNALHLGYESFEKALVLSVNKGLDHEESSEEYEPFDEAVYSDLKEGTEEVAGRKAVKIDIQLANSVDYKSHGIFRKKNRDKPTSKSNWYRLDVKSQRIDAKGNQRVEDLEKPNKELSSVVNKELSNMSANANQLQGHRPVVSKPVHRIIVQGLMAAPRCPWRQGKRGFKI